MRPPSRGSSLRAVSVAGNHRPAETAPPDRFRPIANVEYDRHQDQDAANADAVEAKPHADDEDDRQDHLQDAAPASSPRAHHRPAALLARWHANAPSRGGRAGPTRPGDRLQPLWHGHPADGRAMRACLHLARHRSRASHRRPARWTLVLDHSFVLPAPAGLPWRASVLTVVSGCPGIANESQASTSPGYRQVPKPSRGILPDSELRGAMPRIADALPVPAPKSPIWQSRHG